MEPTSEPVVTTRSKPIVRIIGMVVAFVVLTVGSIAIYFALFSGRSYMDDGYASDAYDCNVVGIPIHGDIYTYLPTDLGGGEDGEAEPYDAVSSEYIVDSIEQADQDEAIKAILIEIDSAGGFPVAAEEIANALKSATKPTVAVIRQSGLSAAYWIATGADKIYASRNSDVGSIGVTMSYLRNLNEPGQYVQISSGKYKDAGDPDKDLTSEEKALFMRDVNITHRNFIEAVAANRGLSVEAVTAIADGSSVLGVQAKELGLIDEIGSWNEALNYLDGEIGEPVEVCWQ